MYTFLWLFSHESKVRNLNFNSKCAFELKFERQYFGPCVCQSHHDACAFQMTVRRCFPDTHLANHAAKSPYECPDLKIVIWGVELSDLLTTSAYIPHAAYVQKHRKCELHACLIGRVPKTFFSRSGMLNPKFGLSCVHCTIQISQLLLLCVHCIIQNAQFKW